MAAYDPKSILPRRDWCSVLMDERKEVLASGIVLPVETNAEKVTEGTGVIIRVGGGTKNEALGIKEGDRVALRSYLKYANPIPTEEKWPSGAAKEYFLMNTDDIMGVLGPDTVMGIFSRPAMSAVDSVNAQGDVKMRR